MVQNVCDLRPDRQDLSQHCATFDQKLYPLLGIGLMDLRVRGRGGGGVPIYSAARLSC